MPDEPRPERDAQAEKNEGPASDPGETLAGETATLSPEGPQPGETERRPPVEATSPQPESASEAGLHDVTGALRSYLRGRAGSLARLVRAHRVAAAIAAFAVVAAAVAAIAALTAAPQLPARELVEQDALALEAPVYAPGSFGHDDILVAREAEVRSIAAGDQRETARAEVLVTYLGSYVKAEKVTTIGYALSEGSWVADGSSEDARVSWSALEGPDAGKIVSNVGVLLARADQQLSGQGEDGDATLEQLYQGANVRLDLLEFDSESGSCSMELTCTKTETFEAYECRLSAGLAFRSLNGKWELERLSVADGGKTRSLEPLVGTWSGTFVSQATDGTKCLAGRPSGLSLNVESTRTEGGVTQATGTVSGVAHYHGHPSRDAEGCPGDLTLTEVPFTATLVDDEDGTLVLEATLPEDVDGTTTLTLRLGEKDNPAAAVAELTSSSTQTGSILFFPVEETVAYTDTFSLVRTA